MTVTEPVPSDSVLGLRAGDLVEVRSAEEILATLDEHAELDALPFMPEMLAYCGRRMTVAKVAHKVCDNIARTGMRRMERAVHLTDVRCDGSAHGGCENACLLHWKEAWLKRVPPDTAPLPTSLSTEGYPTLPLLVKATRKEPGPGGVPRYSCQATEMFRATPTAMPLREFGQFVEDVRTGNAGLLAVIRTVLIGLFNRLQALTTKVLPGRLRFRGGRSWGFLEGKVLTGRTPSQELNLQPGELVRIKSKDQIVATLNPELLNRGMGFDTEMSRFCGRTARVRCRVNQVLDERTGTMLTLKNPCIVLDGIVCEGAFTVSCPRAYVPFWREIWLERIEEPNR